MPATTILPTKEFPLKGYHWQMLLRKLEPKMIYRKSNILVTANGKIGITGLC